MCDRINAKSEMRKSLSENNFLDTTPMIAFIEAKNKSAKTIYAKIECADCNAEYILAYLNVK
ncbi:hypothetical protein FLAVO9AF_130119 [Flavobacterium sp. 9AF]|nr:hypothetical protein FLAVO9AF_130119 [Flavobacterium sp. 9AF]